MDKLTTEEKAKAYDFSLKRAKKLYEQGTITESLSYVFPQLRKKSEDEIVIAALKSGINGLLKEEYHLKGIGGISFDRINAWLEKQKTSEEAIQYLKENHSPSEVSDFQTAMNIAVAKAYDKGVKDGLENKGQTFTKKDVDDAWLKGMCDAKHELEKQGEPIGDNEKKELKKISQRMISAEAKEAMYGKPAAWSDEDKEMLREALALIETVEDIDKAKDCFLDVKNWLKSLKQRIGG